MSKKYYLVLSAAIAALALSGCGKKEEPQAEPVTEALAADEAPAGDDLSIEETESETPLEPITPSDYLVADPSEYVKLGDLSGLKATQTLYDITDEMVQDYIQDEREAYSEENEVDRAAAAGDLIYADVTSAISGKADSEDTESTYLTLGDAEYGEDFDRELTGASAGDTLQFTCSYSDDAWLYELNEDWINQKVDFTVTLTSVCEVNVPEYNDDYIAEYTDASSKEEYENSIRELLAADYETTGYSDTVETLFQEAIEASTFSGYPEGLYAACQEEVMSFYSSFSGETDEQAILDAFGLTKDDIETEVLSLVNRRLLVSALVSEHGIELSQDDYVSYVEDSAAYAGYGSAAQFESDNTRTSLVWALYENEIAALLYDSAEITSELAQDAEDPEDAEASEEAVEEETSIESEGAEAPEEAVEEETSAESEGAEASEEAVDEETSAESEDAEASE